MASKPIPEPLYSVLRGVLHANLFSTWQIDLIQWEIAHPKEEGLLRTQIAVSALTDAVDPGYFRRLTGHSTPDTFATRKWFQKIYEEHYGRAPETRDLPVE